MPALAPVPSPAWMRAVALASGRQPRLVAQDSDIALLGAGCETDAAMLAAANPASRVWVIGAGIDADAISEWQQSCELENLSLVPCLREDLLHLSLPGFDAVLIRRLINEGGPALRHDLMDWCSQALLAGGLLSLTYDVLPGSAPLLMLRDIALAVTHDIEDDDAARLEDALAYLHGLAVSDAPLMSPDNGLLQSLETLHEKPHDELRRILLDPGWTPLHVTELSEICESFDLEFAGTLRCPSFNGDAPPAPFAALLQTSIDLLSIEQHRAFIMNEAVRTDLYVAGSPVGLTAAEPQAIELASGEAGHPRDWTALHAGIETGKLVPAILAPIAQATYGHPGHGATMFNRLALQHALSDGRHHAILSSPVTGGGILVDLGNPSLLAAYGLGDAVLRHLHQPDSVLLRLGLLPSGEQAANDS